MYSNRVFITGTSSGLGKFLATKFTEKGHTVIFHNGRADFDLRDEEQIKLLAEKVVESRANVLVNNAAIICPGTELQKYSVELINDMVNVNLRAPILLTYYLLPYLTDIININSMVGLEVKKNRTLYSATKWGLRGFSNSLKEELGGINVLDVYPTNIKTTPDKENAMEAEDVVENIYQAFMSKKQELILDGRKL
jgi:short-subunit dehydrogenase